MVVAVVALPLMLQALQEMVAQVVVEMRCMDKAQRAVVQELQISALAAVVAAVAVVMAVLVSLFSN